MGTVLEEALASNVASQKWGKEMAGAWHQANKELLQFKEAAINRISELEEQLKQYTAYRPKSTKILKSLWQPHHGVNHRGSPNRWS